MQITQETVNVNVPWLDFPEDIDKAVLHFENTKEQWTQELVRVTELRSV